MKQKIKNADVVLCTTFGDSGKGRFVDLFCESGNYEYVVRFQGGNNAGHTLVVGGVTYKLNTLPSGVLHPNLKNIIANGVVVNPESLIKEISQFPEDSLKGRLFISDKAHAILPIYIYEDIVKSQDKIGTTGRGIGPTYAAKSNRTGIRMGEKDKLEEVFGKEIVRFLEPYIVYSATEMLQKSDGNILLEGAQGTFLDIDHGTYPFVTSSNTTIGACFTGTGLNHKNIRTVYGLSKAYSTRVGNGPYATEILDETQAERLRKLGNEYGTTTGRPRRVGWLDAVLTKQACLLNGVDKLIITKLDVLDSYDSIPVCVEYNCMGEAVYENFEGWKHQGTTFGVRDWDKLPENARRFIGAIQDLVGTEISHISTSPEREDVITL